MNINGWDISGAQAKQWNVTPGFSDIENESEWQRGSPLPFFINGSIGWKTIRITFLVYGSDRNEILQNCSTLLSHMMSESVTLELDKFDHKFCGFMSKHDFTENPLARLKVTSNRLSKLTVDFSCYEFAEQPNGSPFSEFASGMLETVVTNPGNIRTPCMVEITPKVGMEQLTITGINRNLDTGENLRVVIRSLTANSTVILDGESGKITENGANKAADVDIWSLPILLPGETRITLDSTWTDMTVKYRPEFYVGGKNMTNQEMLNAYNGLKLFQEKEAQIYKEDGKKILSGKIKLSYAINKNTNLLLNALKPYEDTRKELMEEYRDLEQEEKAIEEEKKRAEQEKRAPGNVDIILKEGKSVKELNQKIQELLGLEMDFEVHKVSLEEFDGLDIGSWELGIFMFMIED